jgi:predicted DNA-binding transcriptional regulator AlpA
MTMQAKKTTTRLLDRDMLRDLVGHGLKWAAFSNWLSRATKESDFPRPVRIGPRAVCWREDEVLAWVESRPRSDASASPRRPAEKTEEARS